MSVDAIGGTVGAGLADLQRSVVNQDDFLRIFLSQLSFQDPLNPVDNREFIAQLAQFASVEQTRQLNENVEGLLSVQATSQTFGLLGRQVEVASQEGRATGTVTTLQFISGAPLLSIQLDGGGFMQGVSPTRVTLVRGATP